MGSISLRLLMLVCIIASGQAYYRVCYVPNWAQYRTGAGQFLPEDIDPALCTHLVHAFFRISGTRLQTYEWNDEDLLERTVALRARNPSLKVLVAVGGWTADNTYFSPLVASEANMAAFAASTVTYLRQHDLDGLDLDWEYPGERGSGPEDVPRFTRLCQVLWEAFQRDAVTTGRERLLLTAAVYGSPSSSYEPAKLASYLDWVGLMSYDFRGTWEDTTGHHSLLYPESDNGRRFWTEGGFPVSKLLLGLGTYGKAWRLTSQPTSSDLGYNQPAPAAASPGPYSQSAGTLQYAEICLKVRNEGWTLSYLSEGPNAAVAWGLVNGNWEWAGFDDVNSLQPKLQYVRDLGMLGAMVWDMTQDDFRGNCGGGRYPLLSAIRQGLPDNVITPPEATIQPTPLPTTTPTTTTTTTTTTTARPSLLQFVACPIENVYFGGSLAESCVVGNRVDSRPNVYYNVCFGRLLAITCSCQNGFAFSLTQHQCARLF